MELHIKNQLNEGLSIEFCCGDKEYQLKPNEETVIEITEDTCMYFDSVKAKTDYVDDFKPVAYVPGEEMAYIYIIVFIFLTIFAVAYIFGLCPRWMY